MKAILWLLLVMEGLSGARAQGTVRFSNVSADFRIGNVDRLVRFDPVTVGTNPRYNPYGTNNAPVVNFNSSYRAQLYYGNSTATEASLIPVTSAPALFRSSSTTAEPGTWAPGNRTLFGFNPGETVNLQVRVWDITYASSWEEYLQVRQGLGGESAIFRFVGCPDPLCPPDGDSMVNFQGFTIGIPEPSSLALCLAGLMVLCFVLPKKRKPHLK